MPNSPKRSIFNIFRRSRPKEAESVNAASEAPLYTESAINNGEAYTNSGNRAFNRQQEAHAISQIIDAESLLNRRLDELQSTQSLYTNAQMDLSLVNGALGDTRISRIMDNWRLAETPEISWCIDEILSELMDVEAEVIPGKSYERLNLKTKEIIDAEFNRFIELFNYNSEQFADDLTRFIVEGELAYEAIVAENNPEFGIIGIRRLYADSFVAVNSPIIDKGFVLNVDLDSVFNSSGIQKSNTGLNFSGGGGEIGTRGKTQSRLIFNKETNTYETDKTHVALTFPDVAYLCFGKTYINNTLTPYSLIDKAREPYFQLSVLQQAAVVMRVTRSPERLLFNIDTGGMSDKLAVEYLRKFGNALTKRKTVLPDGNISQQYNPSTMLESWIFGKNHESGGTSVQSVASTADYSQIADIEYFHNRLLNIFKIPYSRITNAEKTQIITSNNLPYDECRFYKFVQSSIQSKFDIALTQLFLYHLKLKGITVSQMDITVKLSSPNRYTLFIEQASLNAKLENYSAFADRSEFNKYLLMRKYLGMSLSEIKAHIKMNAKMGISPGSEGDEGGGEFYAGDDDYGASGGGDFEGEDDFGDDFGDFGDSGGGPGDADEGTDIGDTGGEEGEEDDEETPASII